MNKIHIKIIQDFILKNPIYDESGNNNYDELSLCYLCLNVYIYQEDFAFFSKESPFGLVIHSGICSRCCLSHRDNEHVLTKYKEKSYNVDRLKEIEEMIKMHALGVQNIYNEFVKMKDEIAYLKNTVAFLDSKYDEERAKIIYEPMKNDTQCGRKKNTSKTQR